MKLDARFGATNATVVDLDRPDRSKAGFAVLAEFPREIYDDGKLAHVMAAAPQLLDALRVLGNAIPVGSITVHHIAAARAAIALAEGRTDAP
jgi:hypothetical protein